MASGMTLPFNEFSPWMNRAAVPQPRIETDLKADIVIIGGGYTGLSTALALKAAGVDAVVVEKDICGSGASGRNAGHLTPTIGKDLSTCVKMFGRERGAALARFADRAVEHVEHTLKDLAIDCDYQPTGNIIAGVHEKQRAALKRAADIAADLGVAVSFLDEDAMRARRMPKAFKFGVLEEKGGHLHPGKYIEGLKAAALAAGIRIFENTPVTNLTEGSTAVLETPHGTIRAGTVVLATNAYTPFTLGLLKSRIYPLRVTLLRTRPLSPEQLEALGWDGREGVYTAHELLENYRIGPDNRLHGGSKTVQYRFASQPADGNQQATFRKWAELLAIRFPDVPGLEIETFWGGWIGMTLDFLPLTGRYGKSGNIFYGLGFNGHGIAQASYCGRMIADQILGRDNEDVDLLRRSPFPLPPEPLRWAGVNALLFGLGLMDRGIDADLARANAAAP